MIGDLSRTVMHFCDSSVLLLSKGVPKRYCIWHRNMLQCMQTTQGGNHATDAHLRKAEKNHSVQCKAR